MVVPKKTQNKQTKTQKKPPKVTLSFTCTDYKYDGYLDGNSFSEAGSVFCQHWWIVHTVHCWHFCL